MAISDLTLDQRLIPIFPSDGALPAPTLPDLSTSSLHCIFVAVNYIYPQEYLSVVQVTLRSKAPIETSLDAGQVLPEAWTRQTPNMPLPVIVWKLCIQ